MTITISKEQYQLTQNDITFFWANINSDKTYDEALQLLVNRVVARVLLKVSEGISS